MSTLCVQNTSGVRIFFIVTMSYFHENLNQLQNHKWILSRLKKFPSDVAREMVTIRVDPGKSRQSRELGSDEGSLWNYWNVFYFAILSIGREFSFLPPFWHTLFVCRILGFEFGARKERFEFNSLPSGLMSFSRDFFTFSAFTVCIACTVFQNGLQTFSRPSKNSRKRVLSR